MSKYIKYVCRTCGSDDVGTDAWAEWDPVRMENVLKNSFDQEFCFNCEAECHTDEVEINDLEEIAVLDQLKAKFKAEQAAQQMLQALELVVEYGDSEFVLQRKTVDEPEWLITVRAAYRKAKGE